MAASINGEFCTRKLRSTREYGGHWKCDKFDLELAIAESIAQAAATPTTQQKEKGGPSTATATEAGEPTQESKRGLPSVSVEGQCPAVTEDFLNEPSLMKRQERNIHRKRKLNAIDPGSTSIATTAKAAERSQGDEGEPRPFLDDEQRQDEHQGFLDRIRLTKTQKRSRLRKRRADAVDPDGHEVAAIHINNSTSFSSTTFDATHAIHSETGYIGRRDGGIDFSFLTGDYERQHAELEDRGYRFLDPPPESNYPILDRKERVFCVKLSRDGDAPQRTADLDNEYMPLYEAIGKQDRHRRGDFSTCKFGFSYGMGQPEPWNVDNSVLRVRHAINRFRSSKPVQRVFKYVEGGYKTWFPRVRSHCLDVQARIRHNQPMRPRDPRRPDVDPKLRPPLEGSAFTAYLAYGPSAMYISGSFDGSRGGQLILHEPRLVIHLYPGDIIFFPSACITHGNLPIATGETRRSLVLYMAGGLVRYDAQGLRTKAAWEANPNGPDEIEAHDAKGEERWETGWELYSTLKDLITTHN